jgi:hypothetical protein
MRKRKGGHAGPPKQTRQHDREEEELLRLHRTLNGVLAHICSTGRESTTASATRLRDYGRHES